VTNAWLSAVAFATGAAVMVIELMAVRLMAPWFGQSQLVWTNVIGVVLGALAAGQWLGGRWAESERGLRPAWLLLVAGAWAVALPDLVRILAAVAVPTDLPLLEAYPFVTWGSLMVAILAMGLPLLALGAMTPWLVRLSREATAVPGRVAGRLLAAGTAGSLLGTFGATHVLLGWVGSAGAVRVAGLVVVVVAGALGFLDRRPSRRALGWLLLPAAAWWWPATEPDSGTVLEERETPYQWARVLEADDGTRLLSLNEGLDSFHSLHRPGSFWTGTYFDAFLIPSLLAPTAPDGARDVLVIGLAAGTMARQLLEVAPDSRVRGVEIDAAIVEMGRRWFDLPEAVDVAAGVDGRVALSCDERRYGAILIDAYAQQIYLPPHLCTEEFFRSVSEHLVDGGVAAINIGGMSREDPVVNAVAGTFGSVFEGAQLARVLGTRNFLVLGFRGAVPGRDELRARLGRVALPGPEEGVGGIDWVWETPLLAPVDPPVAGPLRDAAAPVEALAHASWRSAAWSRRAPASGRHAGRGPRSCSSLLPGTRTSGRRPTPNSSSATSPSSGVTSPRPLPTTVVRRACRRQWVPVRWRRSPGRRGPTRIWRGRKSSAKSGSDRDSRASGRP
jgi:predicted membrane-bound spermidine synthase